MEPTKLLLLALAGLVMTGCIVREGGGYYGRGYGYEQRGYYDRGYYDHHDDYGRPRYWR